MFDMFRGDDHGIGIVEAGEPQSSVTGASSPGLRVKVASTGFYAPPRVETAAELAPRIGASEEWIVDAHRGAGTPDLRGADRGHGRSRRPRGAALGRSAGPDRLRVGLPPAAHPRHLRVRSARARSRRDPRHSVHASCLSFLVAFHSAAALVAAGAYRRVLVVSAERGTFGRNLAEPESAALLGDGAAAAVLEPTPKDEASALVGWRMSTWPKGAGLTELRGYGLSAFSQGPRYPDGGPPVQDGRARGLQDGPPSRPAAGPGVAEGPRPDPGRRGLGGSAPGLRAGLDMLPRLGFPAERTVNIVGQFGNCVAASIPMALAHLASSGRVKRGQRVLLLGTGAGFSVAGALLRW